MVEKGSLSRLLYIRFQKLCPGLGRCVPVTEAFGDAHASPCLNLCLCLCLYCFCLHMCFSSTWLLRRDRLKKGGFRAKQQDTFLMYTFHLFNLCGLPKKKFLALLSSYVQNLDGKMIKDDIVKFFTLMNLENSQGFFRLADFVCLDHWEFHCGVYHCKSFMFSQTWRWNRYQNCVHWNNQWKMCLQEVGKSVWFVELILSLDSLVFKRLYCVGGW